jgi:hypothetical protein
MNGILKWSEPHRGNGYFINEDTGLCNRIHHWELGYQIAKINNMKIEVQKKWWPELEFLNFPLTSCVDKTDIEFLDGTYPFDSNVIRHCGFKLDSTKSWFPIEGWAFNRSWDDDKPVISNKIFSKLLRPLQLIKIKDAKLRYLIENAVIGKIGIHIRKLWGVQGTLFPNGENGKYTDVDNRVYIKFIESILKVNPKQKFYLSTDLPLGKVGFLLDNYDISTYKDIVKKYNFKIKDSSIRDKIVNYRDNVIKQNTLKDIVDLFGLAFCSYLIVHPQSTWSDFAFLYRKKPYVTPDIDNINLFIEKLGYSK